MLLSLYLDPKWELENNVSTKVVKKSTLLLFFYRGAKSESVLFLRYWGLKVALDGPRGKWVTDKLIELCSVMMVNQC